MSQQAAAQRGNQKPVTPAAQSYNAAGKNGPHREIRAEYGGHELKKNNLHRRQVTSRLALVGRELDPRLQECQELTGATYRSRSAVAPDKNNGTPQIRNTEGDAMTGPTEEEDARERLLADIILSTRPAMQESEAKQIDGARWIGASQGLVLIVKDGNIAWLDASSLGDRREMIRGFAILFYGNGHSQDYLASPGADKKFHPVISGDKEDPAGSCNGRRDILSMDQWGFVPFPFGHRLSMDSAPERKDNPSRGVRISKRESEVLKSIVDGLSNKEIAQRLNIALYTVKSHIHNILGKLGLQSRMQLLSHIYNHGMLRV